MRYLSLVAAASAGLLIANIAQAIPYAGFQLGYANMTYDYQAMTGSTETTNHAGNGLNGAVLGGYEYDFPHGAFYLSGEANLTGYDTNAKYTKTSEGTIRFKTLGSMGINLIPGFYIADNIKLFGLLGYQNGWFEFNRKLGGAPHYDKSKTLNGYDAGVGAEILLKNSYSLRLNYQYTNYDGVTITEGSVQDKYAPYSNQFNVGINYYFE